MIIGFHARAGGGKDESVKYLVEEHGFTRLSFAGPIYDMLEAGGFGRPTTQAEKEATIPWLEQSWRRLGTTLGTEWGRQLIDSQLWVKLAQHKMMTAPAGTKHAVSDVRFENEAAMIRAGGGVVVHLLGRQAAVADQTAAHASEAGLVVMDGDVVVHNDTEGIAILREKLAIALRAWL